MKPKHKIIILICSIIFGILSVIAFKFINNYLLNSNSSANFDKNIDNHTPIIVCNVKGVYGDNNADAGMAPLNLLKGSDIEWITKKGGRPSEKNWAVLYPEKDDEKIAKIINLIKSCSDAHKSTNDELDSMDTRNGYPIDIVIKMKDGSQFSLKSAMKLTITKKDDKGTEIHGTKYKDRFLMEYEKDSSTEYYTIYSNEATAYILDSSNPDFPRVDEFKMTPENVNYGDKVSVSGDGCTENEVDIILSNGNSTEEEYIIGKVKPVYGEWHWEGTISKNTKTYDGKDINFMSKKYFIGIKVGESKCTGGNAIAFTESD